jgi:hypothetical protein
LLKDATRKDDEHGDKRAPVEVPLGNLGDIYLSVRNFEEQAAREKKS